MLGSRQEPTTTLRGSRIRETMNPNSRSPWADWFRFMKSMSMVVHGSSSLNCVCRWRWGFASDRRPAIHIRAGENVCIQAISPMQLRELLASQHKRSMDSPVVTTGLATIFTGIDGDADSAAPMVRECCSTALRVSWPYRCWLPVTNQTSSPEKSIILLPRPSTAPACGGLARRGQFYNLIKARTGLSGPRFALHTRPRAGTWRRSDRSFRPTSHCFLRGPSSRNTALSIPRDGALESQLASNLPPAWKRLGGHAAKVPRTQIALDVLEIRMIEKVEQLKAKLEIKPFRDVRVLINSRVGLDKGGVAELVKLLVSFGALRRRGELSGRKDSA